MGYKNDIKIGFQGVRGAFGEEAMLKYFGDEIERENFETFEDVFKALKRQEIDYGVLPIENSSTGSINIIYDLLKKYSLFIVGETSIKVVQNLIGHHEAKVEDIKEIYSHPQGFEQSRIFLNSLKGIKQIPYFNTATSVKYVKEVQDIEKGAIGSKRAAEIYGLKILKEDIGDYRKNNTRFIVVGRELENMSEGNKSTISIQLNHTSGSLCKPLEHLAKHSINMSKIESRPVGDGSFAYIFYIDLEKNLEDQSMKRALEEMEKSVEEIKIYGCYKSAL